MDLNFLCGYLYCQLEQYDLGLAYYQLTYSYVKNLYDDNPIEPLNIEKMSIILDMIDKVESQVGYLNFRKTQQTFSLDTNLQICQQFY